MNKIIFLFTIVIYLVSPLQSADNIKKIKSEIKDVTVFLNGAQVVRKGTVYVPQGIYNIVFEDLPQNINSQSVQVKGSGNFTILSVKHEINYLKTQEKNNEIKVLEDSLELLTEELDLQNNLLNVYNEEESMLLSNKQIGGQDNGVKIEELKLAADFYRNRLTDIKTRKIAISKKIKKLNEGISRIQNQLNLANARKNIPTSEIHVMVESKIAQNIKLEVSYLVSNAGWSPTYDLRANGINSGIEFFYKANVYQSTGEDWNNVNLVLSTGNPYQSGSKPVISPWYIDFYTYNQDYYYKESAKKQAKPVSRYEAAETATVMDEDFEPEANNISNYTSVEESQTTTEFVIKIPYTIPSDNKTYMVDIQKYDLKADYQYYAVPKLDKDAFLLARVTGWEDYQLLSGYVNLFFEGTFVGQSYLNTVTTKDTLDFSMGRDKNVVVTRTKLKDFSSKKTIGLNITEIYAWEIECRNKKKESIPIIIEDQFPISSNKDIEISYEEMSGANLNKDTGILRWNFQLKPAETKKIKMIYSIKYPKNKTLNY
ncbi:MAG: DUF4139 domain-containing protein [Marinilabiliales bacterium]